MSSSATKTSEFSSSSYDYTDDETYIKDNELSSRIAGFKDMGTDNTDKIIDTDKLDDSFFIHKPIQINPEEDPVAVVIDGSSIFNCTKLIGQKRNLRYSMDYKRLDRFIYTNLPNCKTKTYITCEHLHPKEGQEQKGEHSPLRGLLDFLRYSRYTVIARQVVIEFENQNVDNNMDVEITMALFKAAEYAKHIVFFGSSKKFVAPLEYLHMKGISITVVSSIQTDSRFMADELRKIDNFIDIGDPALIRMLNNANQPRPPSFLSKETPLPTN